MYPQIPTCGSIFQRRSSVQASTTRYVIASTEPDAYIICMGFPFIDIGLYVYEREAHPAIAGLLGLSRVASFFYYVFKINLTKSWCYQISR